MKHHFPYRKAAVLLALALVLLTVLCCTEKKEETSTESSTESSSETAESTEETIREATEEERTAAYKTCLKFLREHREEIAGAFLVPGVEMQENVALCDVAGNSLQELFIIRSDAGRAFFEVSKSFI